MSMFLGGGGTPSGVITMWSGAVADIPSGWLLCDGANGTPNLVGKFIRGGATAGATGGSTTTSSNGGHSHGHSLSAGAHTLSESQMPSHVHRFMSDSGSGYSVGYQQTVSVNGHSSISGQGNGYGYLNNTPGADGNIFESKGGNSSHSHSIAGSINSVGGHTHTFTPPYFELCFIIKE